MEDDRQATNVMTKVKLKKTTPDLIAPCGMNCSLCRAYGRERKPCPGCRGDDRLPLTYLNMGSIWRWDSILISYFFLRYRTKPTGAIGFYPLWTTWVEYWHFGWNLAMGNKCTTQQIGSVNTDKLQIRGRYAKDE